MQNRTLLVLSFCLLMVGCAGVEEESLSAPPEAVGEASQGLCSSHCDCAPGYKCSAGSCVWELDFGPHHEYPCYADCQCSNVPGTYCRFTGNSSGLGTCNKPEIITSRSGGSSDCGNNAGVAHPSPGAFVRVTISGKPGASVAKYNRHYSCGSAAKWWRDTGFDGYVIPPSGSLTVSISTSAPLACNARNLGGWENYVIVGGMKSAHSHFNFYNSPCGGSLSTCTAAGSYCPPEGPCNGPGCP
jgi:hypothetical protein